MGATSIHVQAVKPGSEIHNFREKELDYVRPELSHLNESWVGDSISHRLESAKQRYFDTVGQKMQTKAAPIREGVIVIKQETTMQELQQFAAVCKERFGIEAFQIHIHKDEGYMNAKQWTPNLHAHVVFDWTQPNGKSVRLSRDDMAELQTIASEALGMERGVSSDRKHLSAMQYKTECAKEQLQELLGMERGVSSDRKHLSAMQYKTECAKEQLQELSNDISSALDKHKDVQNQLLQLQKELRSIETKKNVQKLISKASEKFYGLIGKTVNDREKDALKAKIKALEGENEQLSDRLGKAILEKERNGTKVFKAENDKEYYRQQMDNARTTSNRLRTENQELKTETKELKKELGKMKDLFNSEQLEALRHHFPNISKAMEEGKDLLKQITRSRGFGMGM
ncbi:mobilization protein (plasmid) [Bacteroides fragilis]|nr:mobilization protein [Bacteroides fragilis]